MGKSFRVFRAFGTDVKVHWSFFLLLGFFAFIGYQVAGGVTGALVAAGIVGVLLVCVSLHEFGHALVARRCGIGVKDMTLLPIGGATRLDVLYEKPADEVKIAFAGPLVNLALAALFFGAASAFGTGPLEVPGALPEIGSVGQVLAYVGFLNILLAVFNMIPAFPMDGGRILRGVLATRLGRVRATEFATAVGQSYALALLLLGLLGGHILLAVVAVFVFAGASSELRTVRQRKSARGLTVSDVMGTRSRVRTVSPYHNLGQVLEEVLHGYQSDFPVVGEDGELAGMVTRDEIRAAMNSPDRFLPVRDLMKTDLPTLSPGSGLFESGQRLLHESGMKALPVTEDGEFVGMLSIEDVAQANLLRQLPGAGDAGRASRPAMSAARGTDA